MALHELQLIQFPQYAAASAGGDQYKNSGPEFLLLVLQNPVEFTVKSPDPGRKDYVVNLLAGSGNIPRFEPLWWNDKNGRVTFEFDNPIGAQIAVVRTGVIRADPGAAPYAGLF